MESSIKTSYQQEITKNILNVRLINAFDNPQNLVVATARTCYSKSPVLPEDNDEQNKPIWSKISKSIIKAGHHTTLQHTQFQFLIEGISRNLIWHFLHAHPYYNSEQVSQRYRSVDSSQIYLPHFLKTIHTKMYMEIIRNQHESYRRLCASLLPPIEKNFFSIFPARVRNRDLWLPQIKKKSGEMARYVLPLATTAHLYHTISGLTLHRYYRLSASGVLSKEQELLIEKMVDEVRKLDPDFTSHLPQPMDIEDTPEYKISREFTEGRILSISHEFIREFDESLKNNLSVVISTTSDAESLLRDGAMTCFGVTKENLDNDKSILMIMSPKINNWLSDTYNMTSLSPISQIMSLIHFVFKKKMSLAADAQNQRHRTTPSVKTYLFNAHSDNPDVYVPKIISSHPESLDIYMSAHTETYKGITTMLDDGASKENISYLIPNAKYVRMIESGTLSAYHHKWKIRSCLNAQEEIRRISIEEISAIKKQYPIMGKYLGPPCLLRYMSREFPYCPEGKRFCGVPAWKMDINELSNIP